MAAQRDPVSVSMDTAARDFLDRVYHADGQWVSTRLANPTPGQLAHWLMLGINVRAPDPVDGAKIDARTVWARAFIRALYHQHKWYSGQRGGRGGGAGFRDQRRATWRPLGLEVSVARVASPVRGVIPAGRVISARTRAQPAGRRKAAVPAGQRWADNGPARSDITDREAGLI